MIKSPSRRERKKLETRQALLMAALSLFCTKGYDATKVEEITEAAGVAKGTFFNYFPSKESLLSELDLWSVEQLGAAARTGQDRPASPVTRIKLLLRMMHEQARQDIELIHHAFVAQLGAPPPGPDGSTRQHSDLLLELVAEAQTSGEIREDVSAGFVTKLLKLSFLHQLGTLGALDDGSLPAEDVGQVVDLLLESLAGPGWRLGTNSEPRCPES
ncbi:MAG: TetR/AcrR family transcriptional regulator [Anaerolineae bacterium]